MPRGAAVSTVTFKATNSGSFPDEDEMFGVFMQKFVLISKFAYTLINTSAFLVAYLPLSSYLKVHIYIYIVFFFICLR